MVQVEVKKSRGRPKGSKNRPKDQTPPSPANDSARKAAEAVFKKDGEDGGTVIAPSKAAVGDSGATMKADKPKRAPKGATVSDGPIPYSEMDSDQKLSRLLHHSTTIRTAKAALEKAQAAVKSSRDAARAEMGKSALHEISFFEQLQTEEGQEKFKAETAWKIRVAQWAQMPINTQADLFGTDMRPLEDKAFDEGKQAGLAGATGTPPDRYNSGTLMQRWMAGWHEGQSKLRSGFRPTSDADDPTHPAYWAKRGAEAFKRGVEPVVPDDVPVKHTKDWQDGYEAQQAASEGLRAAAE